MLAVQFVDAGVLGLGQALAAALGAGVGGTVMVQLLALHVGHLSTGLLALGLLLSGKRVLDGRPGRVALGLGLLFLGLDTLLASLAPLRDDALFAQVLAALAHSPLVAGALGLGLAVLLQSSNAVATLALAFVTGGLLRPEEGVALVVGANVGTTVTALLVSRDASVLGRRVAAGHLALKSVGALAALALLTPATGLLTLLSPEPLHVIANAHTLFNVAVLLVALPFTGLATRALVRVMPTPPSETGPRYLSADALEDPALAYGLALREVVRVAEEVHAMYALAARALSGEHHPAEIVRRENHVDELVHAVVLYLGRLSGHVSREALAALIGVASELEALADLSKRLARQPLKLDAVGGRFSEAGGRALTDVASELESHMRRAFTGLATRRVSAPDQTDAGFTRHVERQRLHHLERLADNADSQRSSSVHLDVLTILEQMNAGLIRIERLTRDV